MYSPRPSLLQSNNSAFEERALNETALNDYQKATLQAMGIVLYELRENPRAAELNNPAIEQVNFIDQTDTFIKQILAVFNVTSIAELGFTWQIQDSETIMLKDNILISPDAKALTSPLLKKQLWETLQDLFKTQEWS
ncbi:hypothetical protein CXF81_16730 [Glaciecola sp. 33A]|nr:hypothetical protein CXF81_16730 [Glaciecola sp. 33A]